MQSDLLQRITINPEICHGKPDCPQYAVYCLFDLDLLSAGITTDEIIGDYPALEKEDIQVILLYASRVSETKTIHKISA